MSVSDGDAKNAGGEASRTLWHGRFADGPAAALEAYTYSIGFDIRLARDDIEGSRAHVRGLGRVDLLTDVEVGAILAALDEVEAEFANGTFELQPRDEDIHTAVERRTTELAPAAAKMHTGRSRNDQVATDIRLYLRRELVEVARHVVALQQVFLDKAVAAGDAYLPGYTHLQRAQPVPLAHHLLAHGWALGRDVKRLLDARDAANESVLGAGALAGSSLPLDPDATAADLGFPRRFENSLDAVSNREFVTDALYALAMTGIHLSRIGEEFWLWSSGEMGFARLADGYATGSSMMPQKKNPDIAELARGKAGRAIGNLMSLLVTLKGLPLTYNRDLQEDKEPLFDSLDQVTAGLIAVAGMVDTAEFDLEAMAAAADDPTAGATDLAEYLVRTGVAFRDAHAIVGAIVRESLSSDASLIDLVNDHEQLGAEAARLLAPGRGVHNRVTVGGAGLGPLVAQRDRFAAAIVEVRAELDALG